MDGQTDEVQVQAQEIPLSNVRKVTPFSKNFAMLLFILLPFVGGWIGYQFASVKITEVEKVVVLERPQKDADTTQVTKIGLPPGKYTMRAKRDDGGWIGASIMRFDETTDTYSEYTRLFDGFVDLTALESDGVVYLEGASEIILFDLNNERKNVYELGNAIGGVLPTEDGAFVLTNEDPTCADYPNTIEICKGNLWRLHSDGLHELVLEDIPAGKGVVAYTPDERVVLRDGYGDAGCSFVSYHVYDIKQGTTTTSYRDDLCMFDIPESEQLEAVNNYDEGIRKYLHTLSESDTYSFGSATWYPEWEIEGNVVHGLSKGNDPVDRQVSPNIYTIFLGIVGSTE